MKRVGVLYHPLNKAASSLAEELDKFLASEGVSVWTCSAWEGEKAREQVDDTDLILSIGGDGTILRAAQAVVPRTIPITGINLGNLGFMTELSADEAKAKLPALLAGEGWIDERHLLEAEVSGPAMAALARFYALNDVVVARGELARTVRVEVNIDDEALTAYKADGVIVATATGSTGYSLAAGGPILHPHSDELLLVPILPHLSSNYSLVLSSTVAVKLRLDPNHKAVLSVDGHINVPLSGGAVVTVKHSSSKARFLRIHPETSFYGSLEKRMKGKR